MITGRFRESSQEIARARAIDPLSSYATAMSLWPLYLERRFPEAAEAASKLSASDPKNASPHMVLGLALSMTGDPKRGVDEFRQAYVLDPRPNYLAWVGWTQARAGDRAGAAEVLQRLRALSKTSYVQPYNFAIVYASLGEPDSSIAALERGVDLRSEEMLEIRSSVAMDPLRKDPRFQRILRRMNLAS
jgi:serine/threonine-protein kinase